MTATNNKYCKCSEMRQAQISDFSTWGMDTWIERENLGNLFRRRGGISSSDKLFQCENCKQWWLTHFGEWQDESTEYSEWGHTFNACAKINAEQLLEIGHLKQTYQENPDSTLTMQDILEGRVSFDDRDAIIEKQESAKADVIIFFDGVKFPD